MCTPNGSGGVRRKRLWCVGKPRAQDAHTTYWQPSEGFPAPRSAGQVVPGPRES